MGRSIPVTPEVRRRAHVLHGHGGSPLGNSRVKLTNVADCVKRGLVKEGEDPLKVAANQLVKDGVTILHTIGGDDTNTTAADLAAYLHANGYELTVVGLPKTIDNDVIPIRQTLGAWTAAEHGATVLRERGQRAVDLVAPAGHPRSDGPALRLAHRRHRQGLARPARSPRVPARVQPRPEAQGHRRRLCARDAHRHGEGGRAPAPGDGPV